MKVKTLKRTGWTLILAGLIGPGIAATDIYIINKTRTIDSPTVLAESISNTLGSATLGALLTLVGLILALIGWWGGRHTKHTTGI
mgnify:FL=1|jgi:hypothetical protein